MYLSLILLLSLAGVFVPSDGADTKAIICYYESWASGYFPVESIDVNYCTHINFAFLGINGDGSLRQDGGQDVMSRLQALKNRNGNLKLLFSVGGWNEGSTTFSQVAESADKRSRMAESAIQIIQQYNFDGLDVDWEYPGQRGGSSNDWTNYISMLRTLKDAFSPHGYLLTAAVSSSPNAGSYDVPQMSQILDVINLMTYDFHASYDGRTGANAPLDEVVASTYNWINQGASPDKIALGLAFYGRTFRLQDPNNHEYGAPTVGDGSPGPITQGAGYLGYMEICGNGWAEGWNNDKQVPYRYSGDQWVGYDNPSSLIGKVCFARSINLFGVMVWPIDNDDKDGNCGQQNALLRTLKDLPCA